MNKTQQEKLQYGIDLILRNIYVKVVKKDENRAFLTYNDWLDVIIDYLTSATDFHIKNIYKTYSTEDETINIDLVILQHIVPKYVKGCSLYVNMTIVNNSNYDDVCITNQKIKWWFLKKVAYLTYINYVYFEDRCRSRTFDERTKTTIEINDIVDKIKVEEKSERQEEKNKQEKLIRCITIILWFLFNAFYIFAMLYILLR